MDNIDLTKTESNPQDASGDIKLVFDKPSQDKSIKREYFMEYRNGGAKTKYNERRKITLPTIFIPVLIAIISVLCLIVFLCLSPTQLADNSSSKETVQNVDNSSEDSLPITKTPNESGGNLNPVNENENNSSVIDKESTAQTVDKESEMNVSDLINLITTNKEILDNSSIVFQTSMAELNSSAKSLGQFKKDILGLTNSLTENFTALQSNSKYFENSDYVSAYNNLYDRYLNFIENGNAMNSKLESAVKEIYTSMMNQEVEYIKFYE